MQQPVFLNVEYLFLLVYRFFDGVVGVVVSVRTLELLNLIATILVLIFVAAIMFLLVRLYEIKQEDEEKTAAAAVAATQSIASGEKDAAAKKQLANNPWPAIRERLLLDNPGDWRLAIIEADILLERTLDNLGYRGETVSDKLKQITAQQVPSIQEAWDAHKIRNRIAHDGADFTLTMPESRQVMQNYQAVFRDLGIIE